MAKKSKSKQVKSSKSKKGCDGAARDILKNVFEATTGDRDAFSNVFDD